MFLLVVSRDGASPCGLLCSVLMFMCVVIGCGHGRRQSLWTAVCRRLRARAVEGGTGGGRLPRRPTRLHQSAPARHGHGQ